MYDNFEKLQIDKKEKIISVCIEEFAQNGYDAASTNNIVKNAGISKGILFHYFGSKKKLYLYVIDYAVDFFMDRLKETLTEYDTRDLFDRLIRYTVDSFKIAHKYSTMYEVTLTAFHNAPKGMEEEIKKKGEVISKCKLKIYEEIILKDLDLSKFRKDVDPQRAIELITFCLKGLGEKIGNRYKDKVDDFTDEETEYIIKEFNDYLIMIRDGVYGK